MAEEKEEPTSVVPEPRTPEELVEELTETLDELDPQSVLDDDEEFLKASDSLLEEQENFGIFKQEEGVISWTIMNLFDENGKQYGKRELKLNPPVLVIEESSSGDRSEMILSKEFALSMSKLLNRVYYGYYGIEKKPRKNFTPSSAKQAILDAVGANPLKVGAFTLLTIVLIIGLVVS